MAGDGAQSGKKGRANAKVRQMMDLGSTQPAWALQAAAHMLGVRTNTELNKLVYRPRPPSLHSSRRTDTPWWAARTAMAKVAK